MKRITLVVLAGIILLSIAHADITVPTPPKAPEPPTVDGMTTVERITTPSHLVTAYTRLDSIRQAAADLKTRLAVLAEQEEAILAEVPPASRRDKTYTQNEVDQPATPIHRTFPGLPHNSGIEISFVLSPDGVPTSVKILSAPTTHIDRLTTAVKSWRYTPAIRNARRVPVRITTTLRLSDK